MPPHWGLADTTGSAATYHFAGGVLVVRMGKTAESGPFEVGFVLHAQDETLSLDLDTIRAELGGRSFAAQRRPHVYRHIHVPSGEATSVRVHFDAPYWPEAACTERPSPGSTELFHCSRRGKGRIELPLQVRGTRVELAIPVVYASRYVSYAETRRFGP